jgi:hypothetical protein
MALATNPLAAFGFFRPPEASAEPVESTVLLPILTEAMPADLRMLLARVGKEEMPSMPADRRRPRWRNALGERLGRLWSPAPGAGAKSPGQPARVSNQSTGSDARRERRHQLRKPTSATRVAGLLLRPFALVAQILLVDIRFKRGRHALHISVAPRRAAAAQPKAPSKAVAEAEPLCGALKQLLDLHPMTRHTMRHLGYLEGELASQGLSALTEVPVEVLSTALAQLDVIVNNWSDRHLADLRSRMAVAVKQRSQDAFFGPGGDQSNFMSPSRLLVDDVSHSQFLELERQYQGLIPQDTIQSASNAALADVERSPPC